MAEGFAVGGVVGVKAGGAGDQQVFAVSREEHVSASAADQDVLAIAGRQVVVPQTAQQDRVSVAGQQRVVTALPTVPGIASSFATTSYRNGCNSSVTRNKYVA